MTASTQAESPPDFAWAVRAGGPMNDKARSLTTDTSGNIYLTGEFSAQADFGDFALTSKGGRDFVVAKYSPQGQCLWIRTGGGSGEDRGYGVAVDAQGNVFATGHTESPDAAWDDQPLPGKRRGFAYFLVKYDAAGKLLWLNADETGRANIGHGMALDRAGNCFVTGATAVDYTTVDGQVRSQHGFVAKYASDGRLLWRRSTAGPGTSKGSKIAVDAEGNAVLAGFVAGEVRLDGLPLLRAAGRDLFVAKFDAEGQALWSFTGEGSGSAMFASVACDGQGDICLSGMFERELKIGGKTVVSRGGHDILVAKLDANGKLHWFHTVGSPQIDYGLAVTADSEGNCYLAGEISDGANFLGQTLRAGKRDLCLAKFDDAGTLRWLRTGGGKLDDLCYGVSQDPGGNLFLAGAFGDTTVFNKTPPLVSKGATDILLIKLGK